MSRLPALDTARGFAMVLVCLSHFVWSATQTVGETRTFDLLLKLSMIASPAFVLISGITLGYVHESGGAVYSRFAAKLRERGLLLLTVAHLCMLPAFHYLAPSRAEAFRVLPITTTIGLCLLLGPSLVSRLSVRGRVLVGALLIAASWVLVYLTPADPQGTLLDIVKDAVVGARHRSWWFYSFPVLPWFGAYLIGAAVGAGVATASATGSAAVRVLLLKWAAGLVGAAVALELGLLAARLALPSNALLADLGGSVGNPFGKVPPTPAYLLVFGAAGLAMTAVSNVLLERGWLRWLTRRASEIGRSSLVVFVVQSYLYYAIELHWLPPRHVWPLYFLATLGIVLLTARLWLAAGGNKLLVVPGFARTHAAIARLAERGTADVR